MVFAISNMSSIELRNVDQRLRRVRRRLVRAPTRSHSAEHHAQIVCGHFGDNRSRESSGLLHRATASRSRGPQVGFAIAKDARVCHVSSFASVHQPLALRPAGAGGRRLNGHHSAGARSAGPITRTPPILANDEKRSTIGSAEDTGERAAVECDGLQDFSALANTNAALVSDVGVPGAALDIEAYAVRMVIDLRPYAPPRQVPVRRDVEGRQPAGVGLRYDQGPVVRRHRHAVRKRQVVRDLAHRAVRGDEDDDAGTEFSPGNLNPMSLT